MDEDNLTGDNNILITIADSEPRTTIEKILIGISLTDKTVIEALGLEFVILGLKSGYSENDLRNFIISNINIVKYELEKEESRNGSS